MVGEDRLGGMLYNDVGSSKHMAFNCMHEAPPSLPTLPECDTTVNHRHLHYLTLPYLRVPVSVGRSWLVPVAWRGGSSNCYHKTL